MLACRVRQACPWSGKRRHPSAAESTRTEGGVTCQFNRLKIIRRLKQPRVTFVMHAYLQRDGMEQGRQITDVLY